MLDKLTQNAAECASDPRLGKFSCGRELRNAWPLVSTFLGLSEFARCEISPVVNEHYKTLGDLCGAVTL